MRRVLALAAVALTLACGDREHAIVYGEDACDFCRMTISDPRFGAQLITAHGRVRVFDSIECLASYAASLPASEPPRRMLVSDFGHPGSFVAVDRARFERAPGAASPMGRGLRAFAPSGNGGAPAGARLSWDDVLALVARERLDYKPSRPLGSGEAPFPHGH